MAPSPTIRRLLKETQELSPAARHPNPTFHAAPLSEDNLHEWHFTLLGPPAPSPYAGGIYHGRITLPPAYPMKPPNFRFLTPSGRFEVNREICLSISGFHEETWQPAWGVRLALTALRGFMGEEGTAGQVGGLESPRHVRERMASESKKWACVGCGDDETKGMTNEERMKWWWGICREKGVDVEAEIQGLGTLPDDMRLEARSISSAEKKEERSQLSTEPPTKATTPCSAITQQDHPATANMASIAQVENTSQTAVTVRDDESTSRSVESVPQRNLRPIPQLTQIQRQPEHSPVSIDRAITVVFLALCLMILKKVFYPGSSGSFLGGSDDLHMMRE